MSEAIVHLHWLGESCFLIETGKIRILTDPYDASFGYEVRAIPAVDVVTVSHEHVGHNNVAMAGGRPTILRGLAPDGSEFNKVDLKIKNAVRIFSVPSYHHEVGGSRRGKNAIFVIEALAAPAPVRLVHMGDFGEKRLDDERVQAIGAADVLLLPVGGYYTIGASEARQVALTLRPKIVIPMHWKTDRMRPDYPTSSVEPFLKGKEDMILNDVASGNHLAVTEDLLNRAAEVGQPLIVPLDYGPPPSPAS